MRDTHPIDDLFKDALAHAEAEPPPRVLAGVMAAQRGKRMRGFFFFWAALAVLGTGMALALVPGSTSERTGSLKAPAGLDVQNIVPMESAAPEASRAPTTWQAVEGSSLPIQKGSAEENSTGFSELKTPVSSPIQSRTSPSRDSGSAPVQNGEQALSAKRTNVNSSALATVPTPAQALSLLSIGLETSMKGEILEVDQQAVPPSKVTDLISAEVLVQQIEPRLPYKYQSPTVAVLGYATGPVQPYVLPKGEWWIGPTAGIYTSRLRWRGDDQELASRIQEISSERSKMGWGIAAGRTWRSGWGISTGLMMEQGRMQKHLTDRLVLVEREVETRVVTLDANIFSSVTDTLVTTTITETELKGQERSTALRVPVTLHWYGGRGRLLFGGHIGLALEHSRRRGGPVLVRNAADARIAAVLDEGGIANDRSPVSLLATAGLEGGYQLQEHWSIWAGPVAFTGLAALERTPAVFALPDSWGLQLRLVHHFYSDRRK